MQGAAGNKRAPSAWHYPSRFQSSQNPTEAQEGLQEELPFAQQHLPHAISNSQGHIPAPASPCTLPVPQRGAPGCTSEALAALPPPPGDSSSPKA